MGFKKGPAQLGLNISISHFNYKSFCIKLFAKGINVFAPAKMLVVITIFSSSVSSMYVCDYCNMTIPDCFAAPPF